LIGRTHPFFYEHRTASPEHRRGATSKGDRMIERLSRAAGVILVALLAAAPVAAQSALGTLRGKIADEQGGALPGVTVTVRHTETNTIQSMVTNPEGQYVLPNLRPCKYYITT
jgi:hypothetical protein